MLPATTAVQTRTRNRPRILLVDDEPELLEVLREVLAGIDCRLTIAKTMASARKMLTGETFELLVTDLNLPDGDGMALLPILRRHQPTASAVVITGSPSVDGAISALRGGAVDFVPKPFNNHQLLDRIRKALARQSLIARQEKRLVRLRDAVKRLGVARRMVSKKVDLLCNDLVSAYGELSKQMDVVRTQENFRKQIANAADLEQMLCHTMDWLITQLGYANVALWLAGEDGESQLGAYMKYTIDGDDTVVESMRQLVLPPTVKDGTLHTVGDELSTKGSHVKNVFAGQDVLAISCTYLGEPLASIVFFRDVSASFNENDLATLKAIAPLFASSLASIVRDPSITEETNENGTGDLLDQDDEDDDKLPPNKSRRVEDWWKRGEPPPF